MATSEIVQIFDSIPAVVPPRIAELPWQEGSTPRALVYGVVFPGRAVSGNEKWIAIPSSGADRGGFVPARDVRREPAYTPRAKMGMVTAASASVFLLPSVGSRIVLGLLQGEVFQSTGTAMVNGKAWCRASFSSSDDEDTLGTGADARIGWILAALVREQGADVDEGTVSASEIPERTRHVPEMLQESDRLHFARQGIVIRRGSPNPFLSVDDMADAYRRIDGPVFITSDLFLHAFHLVFDRMLQSLESEKFLPAIRELARDGLEQSVALHASTSSTAVRKAAERNIWYFGVADALLGGKGVVPPALAAEVKKELGLILAAREQGVPCRQLPGYREDYTQYWPRGHYTSSEDLRAYFKAMMHFGRKSFMLADDSATLSAMLLARQFSEPARLTRWRSVGDPVTFLIGESDDWGPQEYQQVLEMVGAATPEELASPARIAKFRRLAQANLKTQRIVSQQTRRSVAEPPLTQAQRLDATAGFKLIGQRFTPDAEYFQKLSAPSVGSDRHPKNLPTGLEIMTLLGSGVAEASLPRAWLDEVPKYRTALEQLKQATSTADRSAWTRTAYLAWLAAIRELYAPTRSRQFFMKTDAWQYKSLNTGLGSWTELKHDTILYSEQSYAEQGDGGPDALRAPPYAPPILKGYVEPNPGFFESLIRVIGLTKKVLKVSGVAVSEYMDKLGQLEQLTTTARDLALKEVEGAPISDEDFAAIRSLPHRMDERLLLPQDAMSRISPEYLQMALIADVATDALNKRFLLEAIGVPQQAKVIVKDRWGGTRVCTGFVFSYYEFDDDKRWTDEEWKERVYRPDPSLLELEPAWYSHFR